MFALIRYFLKFIAATAFKDGELNVDKPTFDPVKIAGVTLLVLYIVITSVITYRLITIHHRVEMMCPDLVHILADPPPEHLKNRYFYDSLTRVLRVECSENAY